MCRKNLKISIATNGHADEHKFVYKVGNRPKETLLKKSKWPIDLKKFQHH